MFIKGFSGKKHNLTAEGNVATMIQKTMDAEGRRNYDIDDILLLKIHRIDEDDFEWVEFSHDTEIEALTLLGDGEIELRSNTVFNDFMPTDLGCHIKNKPIEELAREELKDACHLRGLRIGTVASMRKQLLNYQDRSFDVEAVLDMKRRSTELYYLLEYTTSLPDESRYAWSNSDNCECSKLISDFLKDQKYLQASLMPIYGRFSIPDEDFENLAELLGRTSNVLDERNARILKLKEKVKQLKEENRILKATIRQKDAKIGRLQNKLSAYEEIKGSEIQENRGRDPRPLARLIAYNRFLLCDPKAKNVEKLLQEIQHWSGVLRSLGYSDRETNRDEIVKYARTKWLKKVDKERNQRVAKRKEQKMRKRRAAEEASKENKKPCVDPQPSTTGPQPSSSISADMELIIRILARPNDIYGVFQVPEDASGGLIKKKYRDLALRLHPDKCKIPGADEAFKAVSKAYKKLNNPFVWLALNSLVVFVLLFSAVGAGLMTIA
ncbi:dnaJ domain-containing protein [Ditylenchus destructor]|uniref:DnaJ domain-containing protein n=1 Tax=Ditylenchus destructor TaxID=166010 RepID=A0AAD4MHQ7_9BILA|nr:dnaJ domain-containing protein [Ditylenchus destructor]